SDHHRYLHSFPTRRSSDLVREGIEQLEVDLVEAVTLVGVDAEDAPDLAHRRDRRVHHLDELAVALVRPLLLERPIEHRPPAGDRSEEHTSELQSLAYLVCR